MFQSPQKPSSGKDFRVRPTTASPSASAFAKVSSHQALSVSKDILQSQPLNNMSSTMDPYSDYDSPTKSGMGMKSSFLTRDSLHNLRKSLASDNKDPKKVGFNRVQLEPAASEIVYEDLKRENQGEGGQPVNKEYEEYKKNFHRLVLDNEKNLLYVKPSTMPAMRTQEAIGNEAMTTERLLISLEGKYKNMNPEKVVNQLLKETAKGQKTQFHIKGKRHVEDVKNQAKLVLDSQIKAMKYEKIVNEAKVQIDRTSLAGIEALERITIENEALKGELNLLRTKVEDLESENGILLRKTQLLDKQIFEMREAEQAIKRNYQNLESIKPIYASLKEYFPNDDINSILLKYQKLEESLLVYNDRIQELEVDKINLNEEKKKVLSDLRNKDFLLEDEELKRNKLVEIFRSESESRQMDLKQTEYFKENYLKVSKKINELYLEWSKDIEVFNGKNKLELKPELNDPIEILNVLSKMIKISTSRDLQNYLKRVIVSANLLLRRYFPENVNDRFDPDKIYEKVHKYIENLHFKLDKFKAESQKK